ncbi:hypothetical protein GCM10010965_09840 [Caldalkalibacillus thermarum]|uniref:YphA family membrane protein n=1 Tax=Caldalkalibacillus thermarum TaxID=296745 RepID=UPI00166C7675|nr:hypothetical protein [Caldalkalibacillus thermarum]GGK18885.1 hypothetical protein GCM10010965_09840 [Caldalkalibacillus thermarum]
MNDGYIFMIGIWILFILAVTRWLDFFWAHHPHKALIRKGVIIVLAMKLLTQEWYLPLGSQYAINVSSIFIPALICGFFLWRDRSGFLRQMMAVILFLGVFYAVSHQLFLWDPVLMVMPTMYMFPVFFTLFLLLATLHLPQQWLMMTSGMILGEIVHKWFLLRYVDYVVVGDAAFRDQLVIGLCLVTAVTLTARLGIKVYQYLYHKFHSQWKEEG